MAWRLAIPGGILAGVLVSLGSLFLQMGMATANVGTAGVISGLYVVLVPFIGLFFRERIYVGNLISSLLALAGLFLICYTPGGTFAIGDIYLLISVLFYSLHIRAISRWAVACDSLKLAVLQMTVAAFMSLLFALFQRMSFDLDMIYAALPALLYTGIMNSGVAFSLQAIAQNHAPAAHAAIIMSMESLFAVISGWIFLNEQLTLKVYLGIVLMIGAMLLSQFVGLRHSRKNSVSDDSEVDSGEFCG